MDQQPHEPIRNQAAHWRWFRHLMAWVFALSLVVTALAIWWLWATGTPLRLQFLIALTLGIILSLMLAAGLMGLVFVSARSGIDDDVADLPENDEGTER